MADAVMGLRVKGSEELAKISSLLTQYNATIKNIQDSHGRLNVTVKMSDQVVSQFNKDVRQLIPALKELDAVQKRNFYSIRATTEVFGKFYAVGQFYNSLTQSVRQGTEALKEYNYQAARAVSPLRGGDTRGNRMFLEGLIVKGGVQTGLPYKDVGEAMYQLSTFIKDADDLTSAFNDTMKLLVGTMGDARDTTRLSIQLFEQFGNSMDKALTPAEKMHRISELLAGAMKDANSEMNEIAGGLKYLGPIATAANMPLQDTVASIVALSTVGHVGRMAGTEVSAFLSNIISNYDEKLGGIVKGDKVYRFQRAYKKGANGRDEFDIYGTMKSIVEAGNSLPTAKATEFFKAVGGSMNAVRTLGAFGPQTLDLLKQSIDNSTASIKGQRQELDKLADTMNRTFSNKSAQAWQAVVSSLGMAIESVVRQLPFIDNWLESYKSQVSGMAEERSTVGKYISSIDQQTGKQRALKLYSLASGIYGNGTQGVGGTGLPFKLPWERPSNQIEVNGVGGLAQILNPENPTSIDEVDAQLLYDALRGAGVITDERTPLGIPIEIMDVKKLPAFMASQKAIFKQGPKFSATAVKSHLKLGKPSRPPIVAKPKSDKNAASKARRAEIERLRNAIEAIESDAQDTAQKRGYKDVNRLEALRAPYIALVWQLAQLTGDTALIGQIQRQSTRLDDIIVRLRQQQDDDTWNVNKETYDRIFESNPFDASLTGLATRYDVAAVQKAKSKFQMADALSYEPGYGSRSILRQLTAKRRELEEAGLAPYKGFSPIGMRVTQKYVQEQAQAVRENQMDAINMSYRTQLYGLDVNGPIVGLHGSADDAQMYGLTGRMGAISGRIAALRQYRGGISLTDDNARNAARQAADEIDNLTEELGRLARTVQEINAQRELTALTNRFEDFEDISNQRLFTLGLSGGRRYGESPEQFQLRSLGNLQKAQEIAKDYLDQVNEQARTTKATNPEVIMDITRRQQDATNRFARATQNFVDGVDDYKNAQRDAVKGIIQGGVLDLIHGRGNPLDVVGGVASGIMDQVIVRAIDPTLDAWAGVVTNNILALERNTAALEGRPIPGGSPTGGGASSGAASRLGAGGRMPSALMLGIGAYGIFHSAQQSGNPFSGALGGVLGGGALTGWNPIGMAVGGAIGLIGGLFGGNKRKQTPEENAADRSPAFFNTPQDFIYEAYRWRATGGTDPASVALMNKYRPISETAPIVNVYVDGVKTQVRQEISNQVSVGSRANTNVYMNYHNP